MTNNKLYDIVYTVDTADTVDVELAQLVERLWVDGSSPLFHITLVAGLYVLIVKSCFHFSYYTFLYCTSLKVYLLTRHQFNLLFFNFTIGIS